MDKIINVKVFLDETTDKTRVIKDIDTNKYFLMIGKTDANKEFTISNLKELKDKATNVIKKEYPSNNIKVNFI